jgi:predicted O-methyltransferase YrrM
MQARLKRRVYRALRPARSLPPRVRLLQRLPKGGVCAEIGVWRGDFSARILEVARPARLHLIDPWQAVAGEDYEGARYGGKLAEGQAEMDAVYAAVLERFGDDELDFVYIDGNHRYEFVKADLEAYARKIRPGGLLAGDDYGIEGWWDDGVTRAVDEFIGSGAAAVLSLEDGQFLLRVPAR